MTALHSVFEQRGARATQEEADMLSCGNEIEKAANQPRTARRWQEREDPQALIKYWTCAQRVIHVHASACNTNSCMNSNLQ